MRLPHCLSGQQQQRCQPNQRRRCCRTPLSIGSGAFTAAGEARAAGHRSATDAGCRQGCRRRAAATGNRVKRGLLAVATLTAHLSCLLRWTRHAKAGRLQATQHETLTLTKERQQQEEEQQPQQQEQQQEQPAAAVATAPPGPATTSTSTATSGRGSGGDASSSSSSSAAGTNLDAPMTAASAMAAKIQAARNLARRLAEERAAAQAALQSGRRVSVGVHILVRGVVVWQQD